MSAVSVNPPFPIFTDTDGQPLENGYIWIGTVNLDPQGNPITVYWDAALTQVAGQPIRTSGGYPVRNGSPARIYTGSDYSIRVQNKNGSTVYSALSGNDVLLAGSIAYSPGPNSLLTATNAQDALNQLSDDESGSSYIGFKQSGAGSSARTVQSKLRDTVSVLDFGADPTGVADSTAAFTAAQSASNLILIPPGTYLLDQFIQGNRKVFRGGGMNNTFLKQADTSRPAWWCVSNATYNTGQVQGAELTDVWFLGKAGATVAVCIVEALAPQVVAYSKFRYGASGGFNSLEIKTGSAFEVYSSEFHVVQNDFDNRSGGVGSTSTGVITGTGVYNEFWLNIVQCGNGVAVQDTSWDCVFRHVVSDGQQRYFGQENTIIGPTVEGWTGSAQDSAIACLGAANVLINPHVINVPRTYCRGMGIDLNNGGGYQVTISGLRILGQSIALTLTAAPSAATSGTLSANWTSDATGPYRVQFTYPFTFTGALSGATSGTLSTAWTSASGTAQVTFSDGSTRLCLFTNGATTCTWIGAVTATASASAMIVRAVTLTNGASTATWTGAVTANAAVTAIYNVPPVAIHMPPGNSGAITNADVGSCPYLLEDAPNTLYFTAPTAETLSRFAFQGDCSTLTRRQGYYPDRGSATFSAGTSVSVVLTKPQPDTNYRIALAPQANNTFWVSNKTQLGFTLNAASVSSDAVDWSLTR